jgi:hypothetical protein
MPERTLPAIHYRYETVMRTPVPGVPRDKKFASG